MLEMSSILLLNCLGSYFYSITNHLSQNGNGNAALSYLSLGRLTYCHLSVEKLRVRFNENPWGYQPVTIVDSQNQALKINNAFFSYLTDKYHIDVHSLNMNNMDLIDCFKMTDNQASFLICTIDEYYMSQSKFYHKLHNKHFILIKTIFFEESIIEIIDSEKNCTYRISFDEMERAIYQSIYKRKILYWIDGSHYEDCLDKPKLWKNSMTFDYGYLSDLIKDVEIKQREASTNSYYYEGYYYTILSKILPYYQMLENMLRDNQNQSYQFCVELIAEWKNLTKYMRFKLYQRNYDYDQLLNKLYRILYKQKAIGFTF